MRMGSDTELSGVNRIVLYLDKHVGNKVHLSKLMVCISLMYITPQKIFLNQETINLIQCSE